MGEPIYPGRSPEEIREATRHEALINLAWPQGRHGSCALIEPVAVPAAAGHGR